MVPICMLTGIKLAMFFQVVCDLLLSRFLKDVT